MPDYRPILFLIGLLLVALALAMLLPAALDALADDPNWRAFVASAAITVAVGGALILGYRSRGAPVVSLREGCILTVGTWLALTVFATLPLMLSAARLSFTDAFFESMSGITTTGATVLVALGTLSKGLLLWRAMLHWFGGIGIIVTAVAILPVLRVGGMQLFRMESSEKTEKIRPRVSQVSGLLISVYVTLTGLCAVALASAGMSPFDAVAHAMSTIATGGFSTHDASISHFGSAGIEWIIVVFMVLGGCPFVLLARAAQGDLRSLWRDAQLRWFLAYLGGFIATVALWQILANGRGTVDSIRSSAFSIISLATGTGFVTEDYTLWGGLPLGAVTLLFFIGGCTGSTSGGIKVFRFCVMGSVALWQIRHIVHPHRVLPPSYNGKPISDDVVRSVLSFFVFYIGCFGALSIAVSAYGLDLVTGVSGVAQALGNVGPALGPIIGPAGTYAELPDGVKWLLSFAMLLGRLELLTILVLLSPVFWRG